MAPGAAPAGRAGEVPLVVGVLTTSYPRHAGDYAGSFVADQVSRRLRDGHQVEVIAAGESPATIIETLGPLRITRLGLPRGDGPSLFYGDGAPEALERGGPAIWMQALAAWGALCGAVHQHSRRWDAVEAHWLVPCAAAALAVAPGLPLTAYAHSGDVALLERLPGGDGLARWIAARAPAGDLVFVTAALAERFARLVGRTLGRVARLPVPPELFAPPTAAARREARDRLGFVGPTVISAGRLVAIKNFKQLIAACAASTGADQSSPSVIIAGDGPERPSLEAQAHRLGVRLRLPGWIPRAELGAWLGAADVYVQPSCRLPSGRTEGLPVAALEALAVGLPVIAPAQDGFAELSATPGVTLVAPDDPAAVRSALIRLLDRGVSPL